MENSAIDTSAADLARATFTIEAAPLSAAVAFLAKRVIEARNFTPILSYVHLVADLAGTVTLTGTDLDLFASVTLAADVESPGAICIDANALADVLAKLAKVKGGAPIQLADDDGRLSIKAGRNRFNVSSLPTDDFPHPIAGEALSRFTVPAGQFLSDCAALAPCISKEQHRYYLNGIALQVRDLGGRDRLAMIATDGNNLGLASRPIPAGAEGLADMILPRKAVAVLGHAAKLAGPCDVIEIEATGGLRLKLGKVFIVAKLIDGTFPQWERLFEAGFAPTAAEPALFPELLAGAPLASMEAIAKGAKAKIDWQGAQSGFLGTVAGDDGLLFGCMAMAGDAAQGRDFSYRWSGQGEALAYLLALGEARGEATPTAIADRAAELKAAYTDDNTAWNYNGGQPYRTRPAADVTYSGPQLITRGDKVLGLTIGGTVKLAPWEEHIQDWETLCERLEYHPGETRPIEGSYSILMPADGPARLEAESSIIGPDGVTYPVADNCAKINLSKEQVRALIGESCFETMAITMPDGSSAFILKWLWDGGDSRFLTVQADGRTFAAGRYVTRAQIEAGPVAVTAPESQEDYAEAMQEAPALIEPEAVAADMPEIASPESATMDSGESVALDSQIEPDALSEAVSAPAITVESRNSIEPDMIPALIARMAAIEAALATLSAVNGAGAIPVVAAKRTPAHERAVRRAWAERNAGRRVRQSRDTIADDRREQHKRIDDLEGELQRAKASLAIYLPMANEALLELSQSKAKRRRAVLLARYRGQQMGEIAKVAREHADDLETAQRSPLYMDADGREGLDHVGRAAHHARTAIDKADGLEVRLSEALASVERQQAAIERLSAAFETEATRAIRAETALAAVKARKDGYPPVQHVSVRFAA